MDERRAYPSDLTNERWALIAPVIAAWKARHVSPSGHQGNYEMREIVNAIFYQRAVCALSSTFCVALTWA